MARFLIIAAFAAVAAAIFAFVDMVMIDSSRVRGVSKPVWALIILIPVLGPVLWFLIGRGKRRPPSQARGLAPDDDPYFLDRIARESDERIRRLEQELADLDTDDPPGSKD